MGVTDASDSRLALLTRWVVDDLGFAGSRIEPASTDASFRRYFRLTRGADSYIVMDAPPGREDLRPYLQVTAMLAGIGLNVPWVLARDESRGSHFKPEFALGEIHAAEPAQCRREAEAWVDRFEANNRKWLKSTLATCGPDGEPTLNYEEVNTSLIPPRPRLYGLAGGDMIEQVYKERQAKKQ